MSEEFSHQLLRVVVAKLCQPLGWHGMHVSAGDVLTDVMKHYILTLAKTTSAYSALGQFGSGRGGKEHRRLRLEGRKRIMPVVL